MQVNDAIKNNYKSDSVAKKLYLDFYRPGREDPILSIDRDGRILGESLRLTESLSSGENLDFGSCEASQFEVTLLDVETDVAGMIVDVMQLTSGPYPEADLHSDDDLYPGGHFMPLGRFIVQSADRSTNRRQRRLVALDFMTLFDINVIDWYNALKFPMSLREFRASLCDYVGAEESVPVNLPNDNMTVTKTIEAAELMGRDVLIACEQANGAFGHFDREGILQHIVLGQISKENCDENMEPYLCISNSYEEYAVRAIDKVQIRQEEGDIGAIYGGGSNCYTIEGNFLLYGKSASELKTIASNIYGSISGRTYVPCELNSKGLPYLEVGNSIWIEKDGFGTYIINRTLNGISALKDVISATGEEIRSVENNVNTEIIQLKGKSAILRRNVDEVSATVTDLEKNTSAQFKLLSDQILLKVDIGKVSNQISVETSQVYIGGNRLVVDSTNFKLTAKGDAVFSGKVTGATIRAGLNWDASDDTCYMLYANDEKLNLGSFCVREYGGRYIIESEDEWTGMSPEVSNKAGRLSLWANFHKGTNKYDFSVSQSGNTRVSTLYAESVGDASEWKNYSLGEALDAIWTGHSWSLEKLKSEIDGIKESIKSLQG